MTLNREVFVTDPLNAVMPNNGVAIVGDAATALRDDVSRYELRTFVCEGEYARGLRKILETYLANVGNPEQPAVWVSGFYGSGKSHLIKVLRYLWTDYEFGDGSTARGMTSLPNEIHDALRELSITGRKTGGLCAIAGKLGAGAGHIRLSLLGQIFRSADLPEEYPAAKCALWLKREGRYDAIKSAVEGAGKDFQAELRHMYVSPVFAQALLTADPSLAEDVKSVHGLMKAQFPQVADVTIEQTLDTIAEVLSVGGKMPCTLIALDEVQQYIGDSADRSYAVQELTEACSKRFSGRVLFVATGQSALFSTPLLQRLKDRYTVTVELSDTDVETVTRKIVLLKAPNRLGEVENTLSQCSGEIHRHLTETKIRPSVEDGKVMAADYPILPVRRRFWERVLRAVDRAGTEGQLRTQLRISFDAVREVAEQPLGTVVPADFVYDELSASMLQSGVLLREVHELVRRYRDGTADGTLRSRLAALVLLINKLPREMGADDGIRATPETLADLLVEDLRSGSATLRKKLPGALDELVQKGDLIKIEDEYRIQTREGAEWTSDFQGRLTKILNSETTVAAQRAERLRMACGERLKDIKLLHGESKTPRKLELFFGANFPSPSTGATPVWIRDGWTDGEKDVVADAQSAGAESPMIFVFLPRRPGEDFKNALAGMKAAEETLAIRGIPSSLEGQEARGAIETRRDEFERLLALAVNDVLDGARVFQGGGNELGLGLKDGVLAAAQAALVRRYPQFDMGDNPKWEKVADQARKSDKSPLTVLGYSAEPDKHPICAPILAWIGSGKKGSEIRKQFMAAPFGWPQDTVDGALAALFAGGCVKVSHSGTALAIANLTATAIGTADFKVETVVITIAQRLAVRKLLQDKKVPFTPNAEDAAIPDMLARLRELATSAGGDAPLPAAPSTAYLDDIAHQTGNGRIRAAYEARDRIADDAQAWQSQSEIIRIRLPRWHTLSRLLAAGDGLPGTAGLKEQAAAIAKERRLTAEPDPVPALCAAGADQLRQAVLATHDSYAASYDVQLSDLTGSPIWAKLSESQRENVLRDNLLAGVPAIKVGTESELLASVEAISLAEWRSRTDAIPQRFANAALAAQKLLTPKAEVMSLPRRTLTSSEEAQAWIAEIQTVTAAILERVESGTPVVVQ